MRVVQATGKTELRFFSPFKDQRTSRHSIKQLKEAEAQADWNAEAKRALTEKRQLPAKKPVSPITV